MTDGYRSSIYKPVTPDQMKIEAESSIDPATVDPIKPSWLEDGLDFSTPEADGHFLSRKLVALLSELYPGDLPTEFDNRLFFMHPLYVRYFHIPHIPPAATARTYFYSSTAHVIAAASQSPDDTQHMLSNLRFADLQEFKEDRRIEGDDAAAKQALADLHQDPGKSKA